MLKIFKNKKIILLDIDGVLSPLGKIDEPFIEVDLDWATAAIPTRLIEVIKLIHKNNLIWSSTWENLSNKINKKLKLKDSKFITIEEFTEGCWLKEKTLINFCTKNKNKRILIIDDEIPEQSEIHSIKNVTIIRTNYLTGLTSKDIETIKSWVNTK